MQKLLYNVTGQELFWDAPEGRPSAVTSVTVYEASAGDDGETEAATTGSAAVESNPATTFDASSAAGQRVCNLTATTGVEVGRRYLATNAEGETEWVEASEVEAGTVTARHNLFNSYAVGDDFESTRITVDVDSDWIASADNISDDMDPNPGYRVRWVYVVAGFTCVQDSYFDVVRYRADHDVTALDVDAVMPGWIYSLPTEYREDQGAALIDAAYEDVTLDLHAVDLPSEMLRNRKVLRRLVIRKAILAGLRHQLRQGAPILDAVEDARGEYQSLLDSLVRVVSRTATAVDTSGGAGRRQAVSLWSK